jgi:hypothetical protein
LNRAKGAIPTGDLDLAVVLAGVDMGVSEEIPNLTFGSQGGGEKQAQEANEEK